jgi:hypothetical protein
MKWLPCVHDNLAVAIMKVNTNPSQNHQQHGIEGGKVTQEGYMNEL